MRVIWNSMSDVDSQTQAKGSNPELFKRFVENNHITGWDWRIGTDSAEVAHVLHKRRGRVKCSSQRVGFDHGRLYRFPDNERVYVGHTYRIEDHIDDMRWWAEKNGLVLEVYDPSHDWYYHGVASLVIVHLPGVEVVV